MVHWDWVATIAILIVISSILTLCTTGLTEPVKAERMKAEAALIEQKRFAKREGLQL